MDEHEPRYQAVRSHKASIRELLSGRRRIAQGLHDTLLQGLLSVSLQLAIASRFVPAQPAHKVLQCS